MQSRIELQNELDTKNIVYPSSYYKNYMINPIGPSPSVLNDTSNPQITYELPADSIINFSKLQFSFSRAATALTHAAGYAAIPSNYNCFINRIEVYTGAGNLKLLDLNNADIYSKASAHLMNDYLKNAPSAGILFPYSGTTDLLPNSAIAKDTTNTYKNWELSVDAAQNSAMAAKNYNFRLGDCYPDTIMNLNKSIYIAKSVFIRLTFNNTKRIITAFTTGGGYDITRALSVNGMPVSNFALKVYTENDPLIIEQVKNQSRQGVSYVMPDIVSNVYTLNGNGTKGIQFKISNLTGNTDSRLYKAYSLLNLISGTNASIPPAILPTSNYSVDGTGNKYSYLSLFVNSQNILNLDINAYDDVQHMISQHSNHSLTDDKTLKDNGVICNIFDTRPCKNSYDDDELKGLLFSNSGDITLNWQYTILPASDNIVSGGANFVYENHQYAVVLRKLFARNGELSTTAF